MKKIEMPNIVHANLAAKNLFTHKSPIKVSNGVALPGALTTVLSSDDVPASNEALWKEIVEVRRLVKRLGDFLSAKVDDGPKELDLSCQVCGYHLKAKRVFIQAHMLVSGCENNMGTKAASHDVLSRLGGGLDIGLFKASLSKISGPAFYHTTAVALHAHLVAKVKLPFIKNNIVSVNVGSTMDGANFVDPFDSILVSAPIFFEG